MLSQWTSQDPETAAKWAAGFTGNSRTQALDTVVQNWARNDPQGAATWLAELPDDSSRTHAVQSYINNVEYEYPDLAAAFVGTISDANQKKNTIDTIGRRWMGTDPEAAKKWLNGLGLPEDQLQRLLNQGKKN